MMMPPPIPPPIPPLIPGGIPLGVPLRVVGDVHGDLRAFRHAVATDRFVVQLGDLVDHGPDSAGVLRLMLDLLAEGRGLFLLGNHDFRLARAIFGRGARPAPRLAAETAATLATLDADLAARAGTAIARAPAWCRAGAAFFVHGGFHDAMLMAPPPPVPLAGGRVTGLLARGLYGEPTGRMQPDGFPERSLRWVDRIPAGLTVYCGHDRRSADGRPYSRAAAAGGRAVFLDTGAGKGGHLSWIDLSPAGMELSPGLG
jgi:protein phosphatase